MPDSYTRNTDNAPDLKWYVYMVRCNDDSLYTGIARDPVRREKEHNGELSRGARYTRARRPVRLVFSMRVDSRAVATSQEHRIKRLSRAAKEALIQSGPPVDGHKIGKQI
ncbi:MAG: GIY-YIG nuclease family protein [Gammaproteobacteria bacterium]|nr:GIY-YIG nuclease family protein [Gammaproteobacteria bacterium]